MLAAIQSAARSQPHSAEQTHKETFSESWQKAEQDEMANDPLNESFKSGHNSLPDFSLKDKMSLPSNEHIRRISHPNVGRCSRENKEDGSMNDELPWARGHPQPKTGVRGKANWYVNDGYLNTSFARERLEQSHNAFDVSLPPLSRFSGGTERSWPNVLGSHISNGISRVLPQNFNDNTLPKNLYNFNQKELSGSSPMDIPKPYGYGYAPHQSYDNLSNSVGLANASPSALGDRLPNISGPNLSLSQSFSSNPARMEKERHKMELLRQIEDNKRRKEMEKFKEWEEDERRRIQDEMYNERQRRMLEEEQRKEKEKAAAMERKAEQVAYEKANVARTARPRRRTPVPSVTPPQRRRELVPEQYQMQEAEPVHRAEFIRSDSPPIPTLRNKMAEMAVSKPEPFPQLQGVNENRSVSRNSIIRK
ncbi:hypothetical protein L596_004103 [Steinernema carpocapsae]|uniref:CCDC66 domain-containing protein n=1 Tax=Steinernema carpocapsae TaxID=34508 RepID=A0A4U8UUN0_STECR|nr:hypothetical protein L596_004103 [Steinernema carpocapsae]